MIQLIAFAMLLLAESPASADAALKEELKNDVVLRAMVDELMRNMEKLELTGMERPYFIEFAITENMLAAVSAKLGSTLSKNSVAYRQMRSDVRVGSYELDNSNFSGDQFGFNFGGSGFSEGAQLPIEDDYTAIRQAIWWTADRDYKGVVEQLAKKKAFMENKVIEDKPSDFSKEKPTVYFEPRLKADFDLEKMEKLAVELSRLFLAYPLLKDSGVEINTDDENYYLTNSEGTRLRLPSRRCELKVSAAVQADDGMQFTDSLSITVETLNELPSTEELTAKCKQMVERLLAVKDAPVLDSYAGPVLFEPQAAAAVFSENFAPRFAGGQRPVGSQADPDDFAQKLGKRVLPKFVDVYDDPTTEKVGGKKVTGHYKYDDQGVPARHVSLVEDGRLKALLMSRNPSKQFANSTGHGRGAYGLPSATVGCLVLAADAPSTAAQLKEELFEACEDEDLEFGIRVSALGEVGGRGDSMFGGFSFGGFGNETGTTPLVMHKIYPDGREELVRGAEIPQIDLKAFKRILAVGDKPHVMNEESSTVVVPALLFQELDLTKMERDFDNPPLLPSPLARTANGKSAGDAGS